jgi:hypothetical protein
VQLPAYKALFIAPFLLLLPGVKNRLVLHKAIQLGFIDSHGNVQNMKKSVNNGRWLTG